MCPAVCPPDLQGLLSAGSACVPGWCWMCPWASRCGKALGVEPQSEPGGGTCGWFTFCTDMSFLGAFLHVQSQGPEGLWWCLLLGYFPKRLEGEGAGRWAPLTSCLESGAQEPGSELQAFAHPGFMCENSLIWQKPVSALARVPAWTCLRAV